jgi:DsbC/DsbD-like thiol-disulfide interchange protein
MLRSLRAADKRRRGGERQNFIRAFQMLKQCRAKSLPCLLLAAFLGVSSSRAAYGADAPFASAFDKARTSSARLLAGGQDKEGLYAAGVEIDLDPNIVTYWRQPGDAGSPPVFDFSRSVNVASVEVLYPEPKHMDEAGSIVAGYDANVTFPLRVAPRDPKAPVVLDLALDYAACGKICLPARARLSLPFPAGGASPFAGQIAQALALVPKKVAPAEAKSLFALTRREDKPNAWRLTYLGQGKARDLFAETPEPLFLDSARSADGEGFDLTLVSSCCGAAKPRQSGVAATLTIVTDVGAFEMQALLE